MKLQIEGQQLRVRVNEDELAKLLAGDVIESHTCFGHHFAINMALQLTQDVQATLAGSAAVWQIGLPREEVCGLATRLPTRDGLRFGLEADAGASAVLLLFDVDVRDSVRQRGARRASTPPATSDPA